MTELSSLTIGENNSGNYNGEYDYVCVWCAHRAISVVNVTRNQRGWQCLYCGCTFSAVVVRFLHTVLRQNVFAYLRNYGAPERQKLTWFRLPGYNDGAQRGDFYVDEDAS